MKNITFIYAGNRKDNYINKNIEAKDFYYGLFSFQNKNNNINIIEFEEHPGLMNKILKIIDKILQKIFNLPFYLSKLTTIKNLNIVRKSDHIFMVNESVGCSSLLLLIFLKLFSKVKVSLFVMGLYSKKLRYRKLLFLHNLIIKFLVFFIDNLFFLGKGELEKGKKLHKNKSKLVFLPFCIDTEFWSKNDNSNNKVTNDIIFVGNDGNREVELLIKIAKNLPKLNFIIVSNHPLLSSLDLPNVRLFNTSWGIKLLSDTDLKKLYESSRLSIIPLVETTQPSGQSVALQSMSLEVPVMITKTEGFWDPLLFKNKEDLFFITNNTLEEWTETIEVVLSNKNLMSKITANAKAKIRENYNLNKFYENLMPYVK